MLAQVQPHHLAGTRAVAVKGPCRGQPRGMDDHSRPSRFRTPPEAIVVPDDAVVFFFFSP
jgi:hypothetical protein